MHFHSTIVTCDLNAGFTIDNDNYPVKNVQIFAGHKIHG